MHSIAIALVAAGCIFGGTLFGIWLQRWLPQHHLSKDSHEIVKLGAGMIATLTALVLGLLVSSAKNTFDTVNEGIKQVSAKVIFLDRTLAQYGPGALPVRKQIRDSIAGSIETLWPQHPLTLEEQTKARHVSRVEAIQARLRELTPQTETQRQLLTQAHQIASEISHARWLLMEEAQNPLPLPLLIILVCWLAVLFVSFGLFAPRNGTVVTVLFVCACSVSAAILLILEMNQPLNGVFKVSSAPMCSALEQLGR
ncbi:MAG: hypothetical protein WC708_05545 [Lentisphaeria bacterium]